MKKCILCCIVFLSVNVHGLTHKMFHASPEQKECWKACTMEQRYETQKIDHSYAPFYAALHPWEPRQLVKKRIAFLRPYLQKNLREMEADYRSCMNNCYKVCR